MRVPVEKKVLNENQRIAAVLRERFRSHGILCLNLISSPGSGKTSLLERTLEHLSGVRAAVLTGDIQTDNDARRLARFGWPVRQITTGGTCHLDARMIERALAEWNLADLDLLLIENVGNLVCPAAYDLGEALRVVLLSVTEGEDKPLKYPPIFHSANLALITKMDLADPCGFDRGQAQANLQRVSHHAQIFELSAKSGAGMAAWCDFLTAKAGELKGGPGARGA